MFDPAATAPDIAAAARAVRAGELVVFPTETLYGIGCDALDAAALARLLATKRRPEEKGIAVIVVDVAMLALVAAEVSDRAQRLIDRFWPGPLTVLFPARPEIPAPLVVDGTVAARVSSCATVAALARAAGRPIAAPSANLSGEPPAHDVGEARGRFGDLVAVYLDAGCALAGAPSTLVDPGPPLRIVREGAIAARDVAAALGEA
jgi:L-threonylcarbamoyladenylate synthase